MSVCPAGGGGHESELASGHAVRAAIDRLSPPAAPAAVSQWRYVIDTSLHADHG